MLIGGFEQLPAFVLVGRGGDDEIGLGASEAEVEAAGMGRAIGANEEPCAIDREGDIEVAIRKAL